MMNDSSFEVTQLLAAAAQGDEAAFNELLPLVYDELHRQAQSYMARQPHGATLQATALVHEAYLRLAQQADKAWENRVHFFAVAATAMRHVLVDHARARQRDKRGGGALQLSLSAAANQADEQVWELLALDDALKTLATLDPQQSRLVELRFFGGLTMEETAAALNLSLSTAEREWRLARAWLRLQLKND